MKKEEFLKLAKDKPYEYVLLFDYPIATFTYYCGEVKGACIGEHTEVISSYSFEDCKKLETIVFGKGLKFIKDYAFVNTRIKKIDIPDSVQRIGKHIFPKCIEEFSIPLSCIEYLNDNLDEYLTDITIKNKRINVKKSKRYDLLNLYLNSDDINYERIVSVGEINLIHIGNDCSFKFDVNISDIIPIFVNKIFVEKLNKDYILSGGCLFGSSDGYPLFYVRQKTIIIDRRITNVKRFPSLNHYKCKNIKFDIGNNSNFINRNNVILNKDETVLFIPDEKEVNLFKCGKFAINCLQNHNELKQLIICNENRDDFDLGSFVDMLRYHSIFPHTEYGFDCRSYNKIKIVLPTEYKNSKYFSNNAFSRSFDLVYEDVEEPIEFLE